MVDAARRLLPILLVSVAPLHAVATPIDQVWVAGLYDDSDGEQPWPTTYEIAIQTNNVATDDRGAYIVDRADTGAHVLPLTGPALDPSQ